MLIETVYNNFSGLTNCYTNNVLHCKRNYNIIVRSYIYIFFNYLQ